jgi:hypothetical protein
MAGLVGMKDICKVARRSESTVLILYRTEGFPMAKIGGFWESSTEEIDKWRSERIRLDQKNRKNVNKKSPVKPKNW